MTGRTGLVLMQGKLPKSSCSRLTMHSCADKDEGVNMLVSKISGRVSHIAMVYLGVGCNSEILLLNTIYISCAAMGWLGCICAIHLCGP